VLEYNDHSPGILKYIRLALRLILERPNFDFLFVPFPGQEIMLWARLLTRKPILFDVFTSHYEGYILDRKKYSASSIRAHWYFWLDRTSCRLADLVFLDTRTHVDWFVKNLGVDRTKLRIVYVGSDSDVMKPVPHKRSGFTVHFHGHYIPLQGVRYIIQAAALLKKENIEFNLIGNGQTYAADVALAQGLGAENVRFIPNVSYAELAEYMNKANVCLGIFGDTSKTETVIPNKVFEALACGRPIITARTPAVQELLADGKNVILCKAADPQDLAQKILWSRDHQEEAEQIGQAGRELFERELIESKIGEKIITYLTAYEHSSAL
jgi:glycosyltransferase involved in cell wall biosynthesis